MDTTDCLKGVQYRFISSYSDRHNCALVIERNRKWGQKENLVMDNFSGLNARRKVNKSKPSPFTSSTHALLSLSLPPSSKTTSLFRQFSSWSIFVCSTHRFDWHIFTSQASTRISRSTAFSSYIKSSTSYKYKSCSCLSCSSSSNDKSTSTDTSSSANTRVHATDGSSTTSTTKYSSIRLSSSSIGYPQLWISGWRFICRWNSRHRCSRQSAIKNAQWKLTRLWGIRKWCSTR